MASTKTHFIVGAATVAAVNLFKQFVQMQLDPARPFDWVELAAYAAVGGMIGVVPDRLEPATNPNHRQFFHSVLFGSAVLYCAHGAHSRSWDPEAKILLRAASYAYVSHLMADSLTPKGIRVV
jgi:membrane-bound metal-dependent hydrolase YbcI (DUF457 family)